MSDDVIWQGIGSSILGGLLAGVTAAVVAIWVTRRQLESDRLGRDQDARAAAERQFRLAIYRLGLMANPLHAEVEFDAAKVDLHMAVAEVQYTCSGDRELDAYLLDLAPEIVNAHVSRRSGRVTEEQLFCYLRQYVGQVSQRTRVGTAWLPPITKWTPPSAPLR